MSEFDETEVGPDEEPRESLASADASLKERMERRQKKGNEQHTEIFPVPGWGEAAAVELKPLTWKTMRKIGERHRRIRDEATQELYTFCDQLIAATVGMYEVVEKDGEEEYRPTSHSWITLAQAGVEKLPAELTPRRAMLALIDSQLIPELWNDWREWQKRIGQDVDEEVAANFATTG